MKIQSWLKSLSQKYDPYLTWVLMIIMLSSVSWNIYSIYKDIALERQREEAQQRLDNLFQQGDKLKERSEKTSYELEKNNQEVKQCLQKTKPELNECEGILSRSVVLTEEFKTISQEYKQLMLNVDKDYCFLYPDATDRKCQEINQK
jgi:predicted nuclease with TOPRIM domain